MRCRQASRASPAPPPPAPGPADPAVEELAADARQRLAALRASLEGLEGASDRLRETAQTVVEDHGRALVRLDRAGAAAPPAPPPEPAPTAPPAEPVQPPAPLTPREPPPGTGRDRRAAWIAAGLAILLLAGLLVGTLLGRSNHRAEPAATSTAAARPATVLTTPGTPDVGFAGARLTQPSAALAAVCAGRAAVAVIVRPTGERPAPVCDGARILSDDTLSADALAIRVRAGGGGRRCVSAGAAGPLVRRRADVSATRTRLTRTASAADAARTAARLDGLPPASLIRAARTAEADAGSAFDEARNLRLLGVAPRAGVACLQPGDVGYPLARRITLVASDEAAGRASTVRLQSALREALSGAVPLRVTVLR